MYYQLRLRRTDQCSLCIYNHYSKAETSSPTASDIAQHTDCHFFLVGVKTPS